MIDVEPSSMFSIIGTLPLNLVSSTANTLQSVEGLVKSSDFGVFLPIFSCSRRRQLLSGLSFYINLF